MGNGDIVVLGGRYISFSLSASYKLLYVKHLTWQHMLNKSLGCMFSYSQFLGVSTTRMSQKVSLCFLVNSEMALFLPYDCIFILTSN